MVPATQEAAAIDEVVEPTRPHTVLIAPATIKWAGTTEELTEAPVENVGGPSLLVEDLQCVCARADEGNELARTLCPLDILKQLPILSHLAPHAVGRRLPAEHLLQVSPFAREVGPAVSQLRDVLAVKPSVTLIT